MRQDINPCDDFFEYACGSWNKINVIPEDRSGYNTFAKLRDDLQVILKGIVLYVVCIRLCRNLKSNEFILIKIQRAESCCLNIIVIDYAKMEDCQRRTLQFSLCYTLYCYCWFGFLLI